MESLNFDFNALLDNCIKILIALVLAIPIGWERGRGTSSIGYRTFPIVAIASCGFILVAKYMSKTGPDVLGNTIQGMLSGIGFIGGGAIVKSKANIQGIVTAASIWNTGAIGIAVAGGQVEIALVLCIINFMALFLLTPIVNNGSEEGGSSIKILDQNGKKIND